MKRIIFSIIGGLLFPVVYTLAAVSLVELFPQHLSDTMYLFGKKTMGLILAPIALPFWIYDVIESNRFLDLPFIFNTVWFRVFFTVSFDFLLYVVLTYTILRYFGIFKKKTLPTSPTPPPPPAQL